ncbi:MAG TPA: type II toxin-antitoxin system RelE/ParE family toxin [Mycobacteriales bacterium]|nr:type II toxin-antitoxin system RelE/ParE family toxin [Mycobacteriales bacterium]
MAEIYFLDEAIEDLEGLDHSARLLVLGKLRLLFTNPEAGRPLGSRRLGNLTGFRKLVVGDRTYRIVYKVESDGTICVVWVVAGRADNEVYDITLSRMKEVGKEKPIARDLAAVMERLSPRAASAVDTKLIKIRTGPTSPEVTPPSN